MTDRALRRLMVLIIATLIAVGCLAVYSATAVIAHEAYGQSHYFVISHLLAVVVGLGLGLAMLAVPEPALRRLAKIGVGVSLAALAAVLLFGLEVGGAQRWFRIGRFGIQPSEFAQLALVLYLADFLARKQDAVRDLRSGFLPPMLVTMLMAGLVLLEPDLGTTIVMGAVSLLLLVVAKARRKHLGATLVAGVIAFIALVGMEEYRLRRLLAFLDPWKDPQGAGFQIVQSYLAMANGGLFGQGLGGSMQKLFYLPGVHTDFIFALIGEELGLVGTTAVLGLFALLVICGIRLAMWAEDPFRKYLICGCVGLIGLEAIVNMAVVTGVLPTKGLPLPLVSYGGTAMISNMLACALMLHASRHRIADCGLQIADLK